MAKWTEWERSARAEEHGLLTAELVEQLRA